MTIVSSAWFVAAVEPATHGPYGWAITPVQSDIRTKQPGVFVTVKLTILTNLTNLTIWNG